jgi:hypothetical protein
MVTEPAVPCRRSAMMIALAALSLTGCLASGALPEAMIPAVSTSSACSVAPMLSGAFTLGTVGGGQQTFALGSSKISDAGLSEAVLRSLSSHGLLASEEATAVYRLDVYLVHLDQPASGLLTEVFTFVRYTLVSRRYGRVLLDDLVEASATLDAVDVFYGVKRLRLVNEEAMKANLASFLERLCTQAVAGAFADTSALP